MFDAYQLEVRRTSIDGLSTRDEILLGAIGLCGESGEVAELVKKHAFHGDKLDRTSLITEMGDVLWYLAHLANALDISLDDVAAGNMEKLRRRYPDGFPR
jgi:NTP pyrophosphatase (non-canonical NTP hydrolase)